MNVSHKQIKELDVLDVQLVDRKGHYEKSVNNQLSLPGHWIALQNLETDRPPPRQYMTKSSQIQYKY